MRVISWNLWHGLSGQGLVKFGELETEDRRQFRTEQQVELLKQAQADVICVQELNPVSQMAPKLAAALDMQVFWIKDNAGIKWRGRGLPYNLESGLAILHTKAWKRERSKAVKLSGSPLSFHNRFVSLQLNESRYAQMALLSHRSEGRIWVGNLHLHHGFQIPYQSELSYILEGLNDREARQLIHFLSRGEQRRSQEIDKVIEFLKRLTTEPVMIAGDFNGDHFSVAYKKLKRFGFTDLWAFKRKDEKGYTWDGVRNRENHRFLDEFVSDLKWDELWEELKVDEEKMQTIKSHVEELQQAPRRIDYIFARSTLVPIEVNRMTMIGTETGTAQILPSDHFGLLADWRWAADESEKA